ncbi:MULTISPECIES: aminotransferase class IV [Acetobacter]|uniref:Probable branched-chain-amino-acid aminotransferase n=2 Tax=Acetobacter TaxID=434 RepID=A0AAN1PGJ6_9PROT|nr:MULTISPECIES: aminotransferase class IV [Acetobacter]ASL40790.1 aminotransferase [Acetobacter oryzifermentans]AXM99863.1 aminotransferase [Acetobacter pomorum]KAA8391700.1 aminotransferase [Acetobacter sp. DmW_125124]KAA8394908.1 aminotransferase [Acetobacter sp. DmW_125127]KAA8398363.1 aminotransferase [Acetobacter sp. DmW_125128]
MSIIWLNGKIYPVDQAAISPLDRGVTLGDGLFETLRIKNGTVPHFLWHYQRLCNGAQVLGLPVPEQENTLQAIREFLACAGFENGSVRLTVTRGVAPRGLLPPEHCKPTVFITGAAGVFREQSVRVCVSELVRRDELSPLSRIKSLSYLPGIVARQEAERKGCDDALLLNMQGYIAESTISNIVMQTEAGLITPPVTEGALPGIARRLLLDVGVMQERPVCYEDIVKAQGVYLTNSLSLRTVTHLDGKALSCHPESYGKIREILKK